jgi:SAM-dependent methyltransferase
MLFDSLYYDYHYFADLKGKKYRNADGSTSYWGYMNPTGEWSGADHVALAWKNIFKLSRCDTDSGLCKTLDVGCGRGRFVSALRSIGLESWGFDYSSWAVRNQYPKCQKGWIVQHDATTTWPYGDKAFDLVVALDIFEHIYLEDIDKVINEMYRVAKRWIFLQIAICGSGGLQGEGEGYVLKKGEKVPIELESMAVAGHVTIQTRQFWIDVLTKGREDKWKVRDNMVRKFVRKTPNDVIANWLKNTILVLEKVE